MVEDTNYKIYSELFDNNISSFSFLFKTATSITGGDVKLTERLSIPSSKLRGFESGKVGPKDGNDFIGGNFVTSINFRWRLFCSISFFLASSAGNFVVSTGDSLLGCGLKLFKNDRETAGHALSTCFSFYPSMSFFRSKKSR